MLRSFVLLAFLTCIWGANWSVVKLGVTNLAPLWFRALNLLLGAVLLGAVLVVRRTAFRLPRGALSRITLLAFPNVLIWYGLVTIALKSMPAGRAAILGFTMPMWSALLGVAFYKEAFDGRIAAGVACALGGVVLLVAGDWAMLGAHPAGVALMLISACAWAWGTHLLKHLALPMDTLAITFWMFAVSCPLIFAASALLEWRDWRLPVGAEWWPIVYNGVGVIAMGNLIWFGIARTLPATTAGLSSMLIPVVGVFSGVAMLGEVPTWPDLVALVLICAAVALALWPRPLQKAIPDPTRMGTNPVD